MSHPLAALHSLEAEAGSLSATLSIGQRNHRIDYRVDDLPLEPRYEPFLVAALPIAMRRARSLAVAGTISPRLRENLPAIQGILSAWNERWDPIDVAVEPGAPRGRSGRETAAFFTVGVDSYYTVLRQREEIDALIWVHGFDVPLEDRAKRERVRDGIARGASGLGLPLIEVETTLRSASRGSCIWGMYHGAALASVAHLLESRFDRVLIPATFSYRSLHEWGSHPLLDPLWSTEATELVHDGIAPRTDKLAEVARSAVALDTLRVCYQKSLDYNCGRCEKCLRTMTALRVLGVLDRCRTFPDELPLRAMARTPLRNETEFVFARENLELAERLGTDPAVTRALRRLLRWGRLRGFRSRAWVDIRRRLRSRRRRLAGTLRRSAARLRTLVGPKAAA